MSMASARGFTLIEVVGATFAFSIAFLSGSAAFARLLQQETVSYHRTLGASAAMLLTDWHVDKGAGGFLGHTTGVNDPLRTITLGPNIVFKGGDPDAADTYCLFNQSADSVDLKLYGQLLVAVSAPGAREADSHIAWRQLTFYYASTTAVTGAKPCTLESVGRYLVPDDIQP